MSGHEIDDSRVSVNSTEEKGDSGLNLVSLNSVREEGAKCSLDTTTKELAKFGPYVTTQIDKEMYCPGAAHPSDMHTFSTVDPFSGNQMKLTDFFKKEDIYSAMMENETVKQALASASRRDTRWQPPRNFDELMKILSEDGPGLSAMADHMGSGPEDQKVDAYISENAMSNFAFRDVIADHYSADIQTRVLLDYGAEASRNSLPYIDLYLPVSKELSKDVFAAESRENGFLMKDSQQLGEGSYKHQEYKSPFED